MNAIDESRLPSWEHDQILRQVLGKKAAREKRAEFFIAVPCTYCGALAGEWCKTDADRTVAIDYYHGSRRTNLEARAAWDRWLFDETDHILQDRRASIRATQIQNAPTHVRLRPKRRVDFGFDVEPTGDARPLAIRLGDAAAALDRLRREEQRVWQQGVELALELQRAEIEYAELAKLAMAATDAEALMRSGR